MVEQRKADRRREGRRGQRSRDARGPLPPDPGRPGQGAADHPQGRRLGLAGRHHPRARAARPGRGPDQRPPRGRRRHHRQRHHARDGVERDRRRVQHRASPRRPAGPPRPKASTSGMYDIIYKLTDDIDAALKGLLEPEVVEVVEGRAEVRQVIRVGKNTQIAGSYVTDGRIVRGGARVWRGGKVIATDRIESLRRFRDDVREVQANYECGIGLANFHDLEEGDIIECFTSQTSASVRQAALRRPAVRRRRDLVRRTRVLTRARASPTLAAAAWMTANRRSTSCCGRRSGDRHAESRSAIGFATITEVETTPDLRHAKVWVSVIGQPAERHGDRRGPAAGDAVRPARARAGRCASSGSPSCTSSSTTRPSAARACCSCSTSSGAGTAPRGRPAARRDAADAGRRASTTRATSPRSRRPR